MFWNDDGDDGPDLRRVNWGFVIIMFAAVLFLAVLLMVFVSTADFGSTSTTTVPHTIGNCQPFCPAPPTS